MRQGKTEAGPLLFGKCIALVEYAIMTCPNHVVVARLDDFMFQRVC